MGSCTTKLPKEHSSLPSHPSITHKPHKKCVALPQSSSTNAMTVSIPRRKHSHTLSDFSSSFSLERSAAHSAQPKSAITTAPIPLSDSVHNNYNTVVSSIQNEALIKLQFNRTLFCEDITYEYTLSCNVLDGVGSEEVIPQWILRLTVEKMTKFYAETLEKCSTNAIKSIPYQFGKVMKPKVFSSLLANILEQPSILKDKNTFFSETTANFLNIPYDIRSLIQYNADAFLHTDIHDFDQWNRETFKFSEVICENDSKYKYLCHNQSVYKHDFEYDDCCQCYDEPQIECYSYWVRALSFDRTDFLFSVTSNNIFTVVMSDLAFNIAQILINSAVGLDGNCAWIITDYLPKYLLFNHSDQRCNAQIIYKYDPRVNDAFYSDDESVPSFEDEDNGQFLLEPIGNKLMQRHGINVDEIFKFCEDMRRQHTSVPPSLPEMSASLSEYIMSQRQEQSPQNNRSMLILKNDFSNSNTNLLQMIDETTEENMDLNMGNANMNREASSTAFFEESLMSSTLDREELSERKNEKFRIFFTAFIDEEGEDDINLYQWIQSLQKLGIGLSEKQIVASFNFILRQNEDSEGYIDFVDFTSFCSAETLKEISSDDIKRAHQLLNNFIIRNAV